jgi:hypothetical protein
VTLDGLQLLAREVILDANDYLDAIEEAEDEAHQEEVAKQRAGR